MTVEQITDLCEYYDSFLKIEGFPSKKNNGGCNDYGHIRWMLSEIPFLLEDGKIEKVNRWVGFIQGVLWSNGQFSIDEMREHNR